MKICFKHLGQLVEAGVVYSYSDIGDAALIRGAGLIKCVKEILFSFAQIKMQTDERTVAEFPQTMADIKLQLKQFFIMPGVFAN